MTSFEVVIPPGAERTYERFEFTLAFTRLAAMLEAAGSSLENMVEIKATAVISS